MKTKLTGLIVILLVLASSAAACSSGGGATQPAQPAPIQPAPTATTVPVVAEPTTPPASVPAAKITDASTGETLPLNTPAATETKAPPTPAPLTEPTQPKYDTEFPLPAGVVNFQKMENGSVNFQVEMALEEVIKYYRQAFALQGLKESTIHTSITDNTFSMVFLGSKNGIPLVIQGVALGGGMTNVNIRYEEL